MCWLTPMASSCICWLYSANIQDHQGGKLLLEPFQGVFPRLGLIWADSAYEKGNVEAWVKARYGWDVEIVKQWWTGVRYVWVAPGQEPPTIPSGFHLLKWRWIVERTGLLALDVAQAHQG